LKYFFYFKLQASGFFNLSTFSIISEIFLPRVFGFTSIDFTTKSGQIIKVHLEAIIVSSFKILNSSETSQFLSDNIGKEKFFIDSS